MRGLNSLFGVPFYRQIVDQIGEQILTGRLSPNQALPSVRDLAKQLMLSLITIRRAYADLEAAGLVTRRQGHGTFVSADVGSISHDEVLRRTGETLQPVVASARSMGVSRHEFDQLLHQIYEKLEAADE